MLCLFAWPCLAGAKTLAEIQACMRANVPQTLQVREFEIVSIAASGEQETLVGRLYARHEDERFSAMMSLSAPADLRGAAYLVRESRDADKDEELFVYLPALDKIRRVTGNMKGRSLFGTDFSYSDLRRVTFAITDEEVRFEREESLNNRPSWVLSLVPDEGSGESFEQMLSWVDQDTCLIMRADFLSAGEVTRRFSASAEHLLQSGKHWYFSHAAIENLADGTRTEFEVKEVLSNEDLANRLFNPRLFHLAR